MSKGYEINIMKPLGGYKSWFSNSYNHLINEDWASEPQYVIDEMYEQYYKVKLNKDSIVFKDEAEAAMFMLRWG